MEGKLWVYYQGTQRNFRWCEMNEEILFVGTAESEHVEMYLKAIWHLAERGEQCRINSIAKMLNIRQPSVIQMLKKLRE